jgi:hypothetical protein
MDEEGRNYPGKEDIYLTLQPFITPNEKQELHALLSSSDSGGTLA